MNTLPPPPSGDEWEIDVEDAFGEHAIEYWVWSGNRLVPASPEQIAIIHDREALIRLRAWQSANAQRVRSHHNSFRQVRVWLRGVPARVLPALAARYRSAQPMPSGYEPDPAQAGPSVDCPAPERSAP